MRVLSKRGWLAIAICLLVAALAAGSASSASSARSAKPKSLTVAMAADLTGFFAANTGWQGAAAYFKRLNANGGINGVKINLKIFDAGSDVQKALQATQRAIAAKPVAFMSGSGLLFAALPTVADSKIPAIGDGFAPLWGQNVPTMFSVLGDLTGHLSSVWLSVLKKQGATKVALLTGPTVKGTIDLMAEEAPKLGLKVALKDTSLPTALQSADALSVAQRIVASGADGVLIFGLVGGIQVAANLNQLGSTAKVLQTSEIGEGVLKQFGARANGVMFGGHFASMYADKAPGVREYIAAMKAAGYGNLVYNNAYAIVRYGQAKMLVEKGLMPASPNFRRADIIANLSKVKLYTAGGILPATTYPLHQNNGPNCLSVTQVQNGKWVAVQNRAFPFICGAIAKPVPQG